MAVKGELNTTSPLPLMQHHQQNGAAQPAPRWPCGTTLEACPRQEGTPLLQNRRGHALRLPPLLSWPKPFFFIPRARAHGNASKRNAAKPRRSDGRTDGFVCVRGVARSGEGGTKRSIRAARSEPEPERSGAGGGEQQAAAPAAAAAHPARARGPHVTGDHQNREQQKHAQPPNPTRPFRRAAPRSPSSRVSMWASMPARHAAACYAAALCVRARACLYKLVLHALVVRRQQQQQQEEDGRRQGSKAAKPLPAGHGVGRSRVSSFACSKGAIMTPRPGSPDRPRLLFRSDGSESPHLIRPFVRLTACWQWQTSH
uniref:Uncharacterized protein n=1 Tax=Oryza brachyantha TaxID=4533 RepID=J3MFI0_ORYBR